MRSSEPGSGVGESAPGPTDGWPGSASNATVGGGSAERLPGAPALKGAPAYSAGGSAGSSPPIGDAAEGPAGEPGAAAAGCPAAGDAPSDPLLLPVEDWTSPLVPFVLPAIEPPAEPMPPPPPCPPAAIAPPLFEYDADSADRADGVLQIDMLSGDEAREPVRADAT